MHQNLYGILAINSVDCSVNGGKNSADGGDEDDMLFGGGNSIDILTGGMCSYMCPFFWAFNTALINPLNLSFAGDGNDFAAGDCVSVVFDQSYFVINITSTHSSSRSQDNITLGLGDDIAVGGGDNDRISGDEGNDIIVGDSAELLFHEGLPRNENSFWNLPKSITSIACEFSGQDQLFGGGGDVNYLIGGGAVRLNFQISMNLNLVHLHTFALTTSDYVELGRHY
jgi:Ca2+-binding RTX toxin-like protein